MTGLYEGRSYIFRVRAVNNAGISRPSRVSEPVAALDPVDLERTQSRFCEAGTDNKYVFLLFFSDSICLVNLSSSAYFFLSMNISLISMGGCGVGWRVYSWNGKVHMDNFSGPGDSISVIAVFTYL